MIQEGQGGASVQTLDTMRKIEVAFEDNEIGGATAEEPIWWLNGYVTTESGNHERYCYPTDGFAGGLAITRKNIQTEEQLRRVLQFINDMSDGEMINLIEFGWENETYELDENGYVSLWLETDEEQKAKLEAAGVADTKYRNGFNQVIPYFTAEENGRSVTKPPASGAIRVREQFLYADELYGSAAVLCFRYRDNYKHCFGNEQ